MPIPEKEVLEMLRGAKVTAATEVEGGTVVEAESEGFSAPAESPAEGGIEGEGLETREPEGEEKTVPSAAIEIFMPGAAPDQVQEGEPLIGEGGQEPVEGAPPSAAANEEQLMGLLNAPRPRGGV